MHRLLAGRLRGSRRWRAGSRRRPARRPTRGRVSISGFATRFAISTFSARSPQVPSIAEHRSTICTFGSGELHELRALRARSAARGSGTPRARGSTRTSARRSRCRASPSRCSFMRNSDASNVCVGDLAAPRRCRGTSGTSSFSVYAHVGCGDDDRSSRPRPPASSASTLLLRGSRNFSVSPRVEPRHAAAHLALRAARTRSRCARSTPTSALPIAGSWYSTRHVGNSATVPASSRRQPWSCGCGTTSRTARGRRSAAAGRARCR